MNTTTINPAMIRRQLARICCSPQFRAAGRLCDFLNFVVIETIEGRSGQIKEYAIGTIVYARRLLFDPKTDSIVRVEALKLRNRLEAYYAQGGSADEVVIGMPRGGYVPQFTARPTARSVNGPAARHQIEELCDIGFLALMRRTPASIAVAMDCFLRARAMDPGDARPHLGLATSYTASLDIETAAPQEVAADFRASVAHGLRFGEDSGESHVLASLWLATTEGIDGRANVELARALQLTPRSPAAHFWACGLLSAQGQHTASLEHFDEAIRCAPDCALFRVYRGRALYYAGRYRDALEVLEDVLLADPALAVGYLWAALARTELELHEEAIEAGSRAAQLSETSATLSVHAYVLARRGQQDAADAILERVVETAPYGYVSPLQLAVNAEASGRIEKAALHLASADRENAWALLWSAVDPRLQRLRSRMS